MWSTSYGPDDRFGEQTLIGSQPEITAYSDTAMRLDRRGGEVHRRAHGSPWHCADDPAAREDYEARVAAFRYEVYAVVSRVHWSGF